MSVFDEVIADLRGRDVIGKAAHGGRELDALESGRDWLREAYEECLDMAVYLRAEMERRAFLSPWRVELLPPERPPRRYGWFRWLR